MGLKPNYLGNIFNDLIHPTYTPAEFWENIDDADYHHRN